MDYLFNHPTHSSFFPPFNLIKNKDSYVLELALAGFKRKDIAVEEDAGDLIVRSVHDVDEQESASEYVKKGVHKKAFVKKFTMSPDYEVTSAQMADGLLTIVLTKKAPAQTKKTIEIV
jgi:molecular chaperone IbpA